jgi:hypothetical protein
VTWYAYQEENLEEKLKDLHGRIHRDSYRARPPKRACIPKADGSQRPLDILRLEDKIVQQAAAPSPAEDAFAVLPGSCSALQRRTESCCSLDTRWRFAPSAKRRIIAPPVWPLTRIIATAS